MSASPRMVEHNGAGLRGADQDVGLTTRHVLHIIAPSAIGGAESVVRLLARAQRAHGTRVTVAAVHTSDDVMPFVGALRNDGVEIHPVRVGARTYLRERTQIETICEEISPEVVHSHGYRTDVVDAAYLGRRGMPVVSTVHGFTGGSLRNRVYQSLQCRAYRRFDAVVAVSAPLARRLTQAVGSERLHLVPNAYQPMGPALSRSVARASLGLPVEAFVVGWVGRLSREKGADVLLDALAHPGAPEGVFAAFLGDGPESVALQRQACRLKVGSRVSWAGRIANADRLLSAFDALVLSSRTEGTPMVILEAMAAGVPIIATAVGGVPDILPPGTALLVPPESPASLALAIRSAFLDRDSATLRSHAAQARVEAEYGVRSWIWKYDDIYRRAARAAARRVSL